MAAFAILRTSRGLPLLLGARHTFKPSITSALVANRSLRTSEPQKGKECVNYMGEPLTVYTGHWKAEKYLALGLLGLVPTALFVQHAAIDYALAAAMILHGHWGMKAIIDDYAHQGKKGRAATPFWTNLSIGVSAFTFATLCYFNYNDVGICGAVRLLWTIT